MTKTGDIWQLGAHRIMCGDSTNVGHVAQLTQGERAELLHADPPYGMGKAADGVQNDNLYRDKLDAFQLAWWRVWRMFLRDNASAYVWGNAPDLWRLWYRGGLGDSEKMALRNEIIWHKGTAQGQRSAGLTQYATATERALFFQLGDQLLGSINSADYWPGWDPLLNYLRGEADRVGLTARKLQDLRGVQTYPRWFTASQWSLIGRPHYEALAAEYPGAFSIPYDMLVAQRDGLRKQWHAELNARRSHFDNTHDNMHDVWEAPSVAGDERHGHATPKPVGLMVRAIKTSAPEGGLVFEPFAGPGSTLIAAERTGRRCYTMELTPEYVDTTVARWEAETGRKAEKLTR